MLYNVVLSYKHDDAEKYARMLNTHFATLAANPNPRVRFDFFYSKAIDSGNNWNETIKEKFETAHIAICLISENYYLPGYILENEIPLIQQKEENKEIYIEPIYIDKVAPEHAFSSYQSFNKDKPLGDLNDRAARELLVNFVGYINDKFKHKLPPNYTINNFQNKFDYLKPLTKLREFICFLQYPWLKTKTSKQGKFTYTSVFSIQEITDLHPALNTEIKKVNIVGPPGVGKTTYLVNETNKIIQSAKKQPAYLLSLDEYLIKKNIVITPELFWDAIVRGFDKQYSLNIHLLRYILKRELVLITLENIHLIEKENTPEDIFRSFEDLKEKLKIIDASRLYFLTTSRNEAGTLFPNTGQNFTFLETKLFPLEEINKVSRNGKRNVLEFYYDVIGTDRREIQKDYASLEPQKRNILEKKLFKSEYTRTPLFVNLSLALSRINNLNVENRLEIFSQDIPGLIEKYVEKLINGAPANVVGKIGNVMPAFYQISSEFISSTIIPSSQFSKNALLAADLQLLHGFGLLSYNPFKNEYRFQHDLIKEYFFIENCFNTNQLNLIEKHGQTKECAMFILYFLVRDAANSDVNTATKALNNYINYSLPLSVESIKCFLDIFSVNSYESFLQKFGANRNFAEIIVVNSFQKILNFNNPKQLSLDTIDRLISFTKEYGLLPSLTNVLINKLRQIQNNNINWLRIGSRLGDNTINQLINQKLTTSFSFYLNQFEYLESFLTSWIRWISTNDHILFTRVLRHLFNERENDYFFLILEEYSNTDIDNLKTIITNLLETSNDKLFFSDSLNIINYLIRKSDDQRKMALINFINDSFTSLNIINNHSYSFIFIPSGKLRNDLNKEENFKQPLIIVLNPFNALPQVPVINLSNNEVNKYLPLNLTTTDHLYERELSFILEIRSLQLYEKLNFIVSEKFGGIKHIYILLKTKQDVFNYKLLRINWIAQEGFQLDYTRYLLSHLESMEFSATNPLIYLPIKRL